MFILDLLLDDLAKEAKEAPGWISLWILCNVVLALALPRVEGLKNLDKEAVTIATCASIVLFLVGDMVDILVFPRREARSRAVGEAPSERDGDLRRPRVLLTLQPHLGMGLLAWLLWLLPFPLHQSLTKARVEEARRSDTTEPATKAADKAPTGWRWLAPQRRDDSSGLRGAEGEHQWRDLRCFKGAGKARQRVLVASSMAAKRVGQVDSQFRHPGAGSGRMARQVGPLAGSCYIADRIDRAPRPVRPTEGVAHVPAVRIRLDTERCPH